MSYERLGFAQCPLCGVLGVPALEDDAFICGLCVAIRLSAAQWYTHAKQCRSYERYLHEPYDESWDGSGPEYLAGEAWEKIAHGDRYALLVSGEMREGVRWLEVRFFQRNTEEFNVAVAFDLPRWPEGRTSTVCGGSRPTVHVPAYSREMREHHAGCGRAECLLMAARQGRVHPPWHIPDLYGWND